MSKYERHFFYCYLKELGLTDEQMIGLKALDDNFLDNIEQQGLAGYYDTIKDQKPLNQLATYVKTIIDYIRDKNLDVEKWYNNLEPKLSKPEQQLETNLKWAAISGQELNNLYVKIESLEKELTKYKFKYNSKNADYILLYHEFEQYKKQKTYFPWLLTLMFALLTIYFYLNYHD